MLLFGTVATSHLPRYCFSYLFPSFGDVTNNKTDYFYLRNSVNILASRGCTSHLLVCYFITSSSTPTAFHCQHCILSLFNIIAIPLTCMLFCPIHYLVARVRVYALCLPRTAGSEGRKEGKMKKNYDYPFFATASKGNITERRKVLLCEPMIGKGIINSIIRGEKKQTQVKMLCLLILCNSSGGKRGTHIRHLVTSKRKSEAVLWPASLRFEERRKGRWKYVNENAVILRFFKSSEGRQGEKGRQVWGKVSCTFLTSISKNLKKEKIVEKESNGISPSS